MQAYQTSQYVVPRGGIFLGKSAELFRRKFNVQSACALNTRYILNIRGTDDNKETVLVTAFWLQVL
jgi:hypothetical protein